MMAGKCQSYINHLENVLLIVINCDGHVAQSTHTEQFFSTNTTAPLGTATFNNISHDQLNSISSPL